MTEILSLLSGGWGYLVAGVAVVIALVTSWFTGKKVGATQAQAKADVAAAQEVTKQAEAVTQRQADIVKAVKMLSRITSLFLIALLASACSSQSTTPTINYVTVDSACTAFSPIITHGKDPQVMDVRTVRQINAHNDKWDALCGEKNEHL